MSSAETLQAVTFDFWGTLFEWNGWAAGVRRDVVRAFVARHRAELSAEVSPRPLTRRGTG